MVLRSIIPLTTVLFAPPTLHPAKMRKSNHLDVLWLTVSQEVSARWLTGMHVSVWLGNWLQSWVKEVSLREFCSSFARQVSFSYHYIVQGYGPSHDRRHAKPSDDWDLPDSGVTDLREVRGLLSVKISSEIYAINFVHVYIWGILVDLFQSSLNHLIGHGAISEREVSVYCPLVLLTGLQHGFLEFLIRWWFDCWMQNNVGGKAVDDEEQNSMLTVICSQRDRFRQRLRETEEVCLLSWCDSFN